jgi:hypothetical protein
MKLTNYEMQLSNRKFYQGYVPLNRWATGFETLVRKEMMIKDGTYHW